MDPAVEGGVEPGLVLVELSPHEIDGLPVTRATVTFVKFELRVYAVTCHHALFAFFTEIIKKGRHIIPATHKGRSIRQFGS